MQTRQDMRADCLEKELNFQFYLAVKHIEVFEELIEEKRILVNQADCCHNVHNCVILAVDKMQVYVTPKIEGSL